uniref:Uncharacterized protein n=1 Tax=Steinernema glaseri TaxID=37863 RepID=A0A1I7YWP3_9BILA
MPSHSYINSPSQSFPLEKEKRRRKFHDRVGKRSTYSRANDLIKSVASSRRTNAHCAARRGHRCTAQDNSGHNPRARAPVNLSANAAVFEDIIEVMNSHHLFFALCSPVGSSSITATAACVPVLPQKASENGTAYSVSMRE